MTKGELKNIILKIRALTGLAEPDRITYYWDDDERVAFKFWFDSLIIPRDMLLKKVDKDNKTEEDEEPLIWDQYDNAPDFQRGFSVIDYNKDYDDDYVIKDINTDEGYVTVIPDQQDFKKVSSFKAAEDLGEETMEESVVLATKATPRKLVESYGLITETDDAAEERDAIENNLEQNTAKDKLATKAEKKDDPKKITDDMLIVNIPLAAWADPKRLKEILTKLVDLTKNVFSKGEEPLNVKVTLTTTSGASHMTNFNHLLSAAKEIDPNMDANAFVPENSDALRKFIEMYKAASKKVYCTAAPSGYKFSPDTIPEIAKAEAFLGDEEKVNAIKEIQGLCDSAYNASLANLQEKVSILKEKLLPCFKEFVEKFIGDYKPATEKSETKDSEDAASEKPAEDSEDKEGTPPEAEKATESIMRRLLNHILENEGEDGKPAEDSEGASGDKPADESDKAEEKDKEKDKEEKKEEETSRQKAWKAATEYLKDPANQKAGSIAYVLNELFTTPGEDFSKDINAELASDLKADADDTRKESGEQAKKFSANEKETVSSAQARVDSVIASTIILKVKKWLAASTTGSGMDKTGGKTNTALFTGIKDATPKNDNGKEKGEEGSEGKLAASPDQFYTFACLEGEDIVKDVGEKIEGQTPKAFCEAKMKLQVEG